MTQEHPITPPPNLVQQWESTAYDAAPVSYTHHIARCAARWGADQQLKLDAEQINQAWQKGADQELEACVEWVSQWCCRWPDGTRPEDELRDARRPKPLSLKEQAIEVLDDIDTQLDAVHYNILRRALETLSD